MSLLGYIYTIYYIFKMEFTDIEDRLMTTTVNGKGELIFVLKNLYRKDGQRLTVANKDGDFCKVQTSFRIAAVKDHLRSINIITSGSMYLKILCLQKETVQLLLPHQENLARGPKFELSEWLLLKELPAEFDAVRTFVHNSCLKNHTLTRDWYLTMSIFVTDDNSVTKRGNLFKHVPGEDLYELLFLGGILNIFQKVFCDEWRARKGYGDTEPVSNVLFGWANVDPSEISIVEKSVVKKTFDFARRLEEDESYMGCKFRDGFYPTGKKGSKSVGWTEVCRQVAKKTEAAAAAAITATEGPADYLGDLDALGLSDDLGDLDALGLGDDLGGVDVCDCNGIVSLVSSFV